MLWSGEYQERLRDFFQYWAKVKLNLDLTIHTFVSGSEFFIDTTPVLLDKMVSGLLYDLVIFISEDELDGALDDGRTGDKSKVLWAQNLTGGPENAPLWMISYNLSEELLHNLLSRMDQPVETWIGLVHQNSVAYNEAAKTDYWVPTGLQETYSNDAIIQAYKRSGYYYLLDDAQKIALRNDPRSWLQSHPYLLESRYYKLFFKPEMLNTPYILQSRPERPKTQFRTLSGIYPKIQG